MTISKIAYIKCVDLHVYKSLQGGQGGKSKDLTLPTQLVFVFLSSLGMLIAGVDF